MGMEVSGYWEGLLGRQSNPMSKEQTDLFFRLMMAEMQGPVTEDMFPGLDDHMGYQIMKNRLEAGGVKVSLPVQMFLASISDRPAAVVMWAYTCALICAKEDLPELKMSGLADAFPWGFPKPEEMEKAWAEQKVVLKEGEEFYGSDNTIDDFANWPKQK